MYRNVLVLYCVISFFVEYEIIKNSIQLQSIILQPAISNVEFSLQFYLH